MRETEQLFTTNKSSPTLFLPHFPREGGEGRAHWQATQGGRERPQMWPEPLRPPRATKSHAESPFSRSKLLKPTLRWCLTGPGPPLSARRLQPAPPPPGSTPEQALTATARAPVPSPRCSRGGQLGPSAGPTGHPLPKGRELSAAAPPSPHLPAPPHARRGSSASRSAPRRLTRAAPPPRKLPPVGRSVGASLSKAAANWPWQRHSRCAARGPC